MVDLSQRSYELEKMDVEGFSFDEFEHCLSDIERINYWTNGFSPILKAIKGFEKKKSHLKILDVGYGSGELLRKIAKSGKHELIGIDIHPWAKKVADKKSSDIDFREGNLYDLNEKFDVIVCSLFTHHLKDEEIIRFINWMNKNAEIGWFITDAHRHHIPYYTMKWATKLAGFNSMVQYDAPLSVARAFCKSDWEEILKKVKPTNFQIDLSWGFPFKYNLRGENV